MKTPFEKNDQRRDSQVLPPIHIMAGGIHSLPYARFAAECIWHICPENLRKELNVVIGAFAIPQNLIGETFRFLEAVPCVSILLNPVKVPLSVFNLPQGYTRHRISKLLGIARNLLAHMGLPPRILIRLCPRVNAHLGLYLQEYIIRVCDLESEREAVCFMDADFFLWDALFFSELKRKPDQGIFASAWLERYGDGAIYKGNTYYPVGSECFRLKPKVFNQWNWQVETIDRPLLPRLSVRHPGIRFQREMVDTVYQACWEAQIGGFKTDYPFSRLKVCHVGGFGHSNFEYIKECIRDGRIDGDGGARFWIQRIRLNQTVAAELVARYSQPWIVAGLDQIQSRAKTAWEITEIKKLRDETPFSEHEKLFADIIGNISPTRKTQTAI